MTNEAVLKVETGLPINFTVSNTTGIEKGAILKMTDPMTAALADGANNIVAGIAASEKIASDGVTKLGVYRNGIFLMTLSGTCTVGDALAVQSHSENYVYAANASNLSGSSVIGIALETGATAEQILVELNITGVKTSPQ